MKRRISTILVALAMTLGISLAIAQPANAVWTDCPNGVSCTWTGYLATGTMGTYPWSLYGGIGCVDTGNNHSGHGGYGSGHHLNLYSDIYCSHLIASLGIRQNWSNINVTAVAIKAV